MPETFPGKVGVSEGLGRTLWAPARGAQRFLWGWEGLMGVQGPPRACCVPELWVTSAPCTSTASVSSDNPVRTDR